MTSPAFADGDKLSAKYAGNAPNCGGENVSLPLRWSNAPNGTRSFAILMFDPDGQKGPGAVHWVAYGIPATTNSLAEGAGSAPSNLFVGGSNIRGAPLYFGPCPPVGDAPHHYIIQVLALDLPPEALKPGLTRDGFLEATKGHNLAATSIVGRYAR